MVPKSRKSKLKKNSRIETIISGSGGMGMLLAGTVLAEAAAIYEDKYVVQTKSYGPEARGGASKSEVIISDSEIDYPMVVKADILVAMNQESCDRYFMSLKPDGILIVDDEFVKYVPTTKCLKAPIIKTARDKLKFPISANMVALGVLIANTKVVNPDSIIKTIMDTVPKAKEKNVEAFNAGLKLKLL